MVSPPWWRSSAPSRRIWAEVRFQSCWLSLGVVYGAIAVDAEDAGSFLLLAVAAGVAGSAGGLDGIPAIGGYLDSIVDGLATALAAGSATVLVMWVVNRLKG